MQQCNSEDIPFSHLQSDAASASVKLCPEDSEHGEGGVTLLKLALALNEMLVKLPLEQTQFKVVEASFCQHGFTTFCPPVSKINRIIKSTVLLA